MSTLRKSIQKLNPIIPTTKLHHFSFFRSIFAFLSTHPVGEVSLGMCKLDGLDKVSFRMLKLGKLDKLSYAKY